MDALAGSAGEPGFFYAYVGTYTPNGGGIYLFRIERATAALMQMQVVDDIRNPTWLAINPATPLDCLDHVLDKLDVVLIMSVNPGFAGQSFIDEALSKLALARQRIDAVVARTGREIRLEVDGGIKVDNIGTVVEAGGNVLVAGSAVFETADYKATIATLRRNADAARR